MKLQRSNAGKKVHTRPIVTIGDHVDVDENFADGPAMTNGELALGTNHNFAYLTWNM